MKFTAAYDNGGKTLDRYTIVFSPNYHSWCMSHNATSPQGVCQYNGRFVHSIVGREFFLQNTRLLRTELPEAVQQKIKRIEEEYKNEKD